MGVNFIATPNLPVVTLSATGQFVGIGAEFNLPVIQFSGSFFAGQHLDAAFLLPAAQFEGALLPGHALSATFSLPAISAVAVLRSDGILTADFVLPGPQLSAQILAGQFFVATPNLLVVTLVAGDATLVSATQFSAAFQLPPVQLTASLLAALAAGARTWALNTRRNALTEYNFQFTSYALFNGLVLGVSPAGVVVLGTQALDGAVSIPWRVRTGKADYGDTHLKRVPRLYVGGEFDGDVLFRTIVDATGTRTYRLTHNHVDGMQQRRVPIGKGPKARYWQYEVEGENGADGTIENILAYPTGLRRRVM